MSERQTKKWEDTDNGVRGPNIPDDWKRYIMQRALTEVNTPRMLLADEILEQMKRSRDIKDRPPERESIAKLISKARNHPFSPLDEQWSVAASLHHGLPAESTRELFDIWRVSLSIGRPISIRQARWIVHLSTLYTQKTEFPIAPYSRKVKRELTLIKQSWLFSLAERVSEINRPTWPSPPENKRPPEVQTFNSSSLDAELFMPTWEHITATKLDRIGWHDFPQELLTKIEEKGDIPLQSPPEGFISVENAVWHRVRSQPPSGPSTLDDAEYRKPLPEEQDLIAAYWITHLSKGPAWKDLPEQPDIKARWDYFWQEQARVRAAGDRFVDSGFDSSWDSLYHRQLSIRRRLIEWVKTHPDVAFYVSDPRVFGSFNALLLKAVGYPVTPEEMQLWFKQREAVLQAQHKGFHQLSTEIRERFIHDEHTPGDEDALKEADYQELVKQLAKQKADARRIH